MPTYTIHAVNLGSFALGETDKVVTLFSAERGIVRGVAKGARKPGSKIAGRAEPLNVNRLLMAKGRNLDIITQAENIASFSNLRKDLHRLSYGLYFAELTQHFGHGLSDDSSNFFDFLCRSLSDLAESNDDPAMSCLRFEMRLLELLGIHPELDFCISCRDPMTEYRLSFFNHESGGIVCDRCFAGKDKAVVQEQLQFDYGEDALTNPALKGRAKSPYAGIAGTHITPLVWKKLVLIAKGHHDAALQSSADQELSRSTALHPSTTAPQPTSNGMRVNQAARRLVQTYLEHKAGRRMRALDLL